MPGFLDNGLYAVRHFQFPNTLSTVVGDMGVARWYPTVITLQDGLTIIAGGSTAEGGGYGSDSSLNEPTYQVRISLVLTVSSDEIMLEKAIAIQAFSL